MTTSVRDYLIAQANSRQIVVPEGHTLALKVYADFNGMADKLDAVKDEIVKTYLDSKDAAADIRAEIRNQTASLQSELKTEITIQKGCKRLLGIKAKTRN